MKIDPVIDFPAVLRGYTECALWSTVDGDRGDAPMDSAGYTLSEAARAVFESDCTLFVRANAAECRAAIYSPGYSAERLGHDLWLSRNRHGAGFLDREELMPATREWLDEAADRLGGCALVADDALSVETFEAAADPLLYGLDIGTMRAGKGASDEA